MNTSRERILLVENDPEISDLVARQTLQSLGYQVQVARTVEAAHSRSDPLRPRCDHHQLEPYPI